MARPARSTTERGLGWAHQQHAKALKHEHVDGTPCWWCGEPMFLDPEKNWDDEPLAADHSQPRTRGGRKADRLLHGTCNKQRGDGSRDAQRPAVTGKPAAQRSSRKDAGLGRRALPWPV